jgi:thiol-disulfide isomerase/thioredoxin
MTDAASAEDPAPSGGEGDGHGGAVRRKPRKRFLVLGIVLAAAVGVGLFTGIGTSQTSSSAPHEGGPVPAFSAQNVGPSGGSQVSVSGGGGGGVGGGVGGGSGTPSVILFFGNWCPSCHQELPPLAATVQRQAATRSPLARIRVVGVDSEDSTTSAKSFIRSSGVTFPVAYDPSVAITSGLFYFDGDPYAVFVRGDGTIDRIVRGAVLTPSSLEADERALIPSGR